MKSELVDLKPTEPELTYPCLRQLVDHEDVVLFTDPNKGTVVKPDLWVLGYHWDGWTNASNTDTWKTPEKGVLLTP